MMHCMQQRTIAEKPLFILVDPGGLGGQHEPQLFRTGVGKIIGQFHRLSFEGND